MLFDNPVLPGFNPDPSIICVEDVYYMAVSTFEWFPGIKLYRSHDLAHWEQCGYALTRADQLDLSGVATAQGVWAPCLTYNAQQKRFYLSFSVMFSMKEQHFDLNNYYVTSDDIEGEWSSARYLNSSGFDPSFFHDDNGQIWVTNLEWESRQGYQHPGRIIVQEFDPQQQQLTGPVFNLGYGGTQRGCAEGPHIYKRQGYYYLMTAEGGTGYGHAVVMQRSRSVTGPYQSDPQHVVLTSHPEEFDELGDDESVKLHRFDPNRILQKSGHGCLVETPQGESYVVHLCARPLLPSPYCTLGRETAIQHCRWSDDGWLRLASGGIEAQLQIDLPVAQRLPILPYKVGREDFSAPRLPHDYQSYRLPLDSSVLQIGENGLTLRGQGSLFSGRHLSLVARRLNHFQADIETELSFTPQHYFDSAGLTLYYCADNFIYLRVYYSEAVQQVCVGVTTSIDGKKTEHKAYRSPINNPQQLKLRVQVRHNKATLHFAEQGQSLQQIGEAFSMETLSDEYGYQKFTGTFVGMFCEDYHRQQNQARFHYLDYAPIEEKTRNSKALNELLSVVS